jgi:hypothetical protein
VGWWKLDECQGTTANDSSGNGNIGTIVAGDTSGTNDSTGTCSSGANDEMWSNGATGKLNSSLHFDGTNDYTDVGNSTILNLSNNIYTISAWIKTNSTGSWKWIYQFGEHASNKDRSLVIDSNNKARLYIYGNNATSTTSVTDNLWHHILGTSDGTNFKIYVDGKLEGTSQPSFETYTYTGARIGYNNSSSKYWFNGQIDDVQIFNYALTPEQIKIIYNSNSAVRF